METDKINFLIDKITNLEKKMDIILNSISKNKIKLNVKIPIIQNDNILKYISEPLLDTFLESANIDADIKLIKLIYIQQDPSIIFENNKLMFFYDNQWVNGKGSSKICEIIINNIHRIYSKLISAKYNKLKGNYDNYVKIQEHLIRMRKNDYINLIKSKLIEDIKINNLTCHQH